MSIRYWQGKAEVPGGKNTCPSATTSITNAMWITIGSCTGSAVRRLSNRLIRNTASMLSSLARFGGTHSVLRVRSLEFRWNVGKFEPGYKKPRPRRLSSRIMGRESGVILSYDKNAVVWSSLPSGLLGPVAWSTVKQYRSLLELLWRRMHDALSTTRICEWSWSDIHENQYLQQIALTISNLKTQQFLNPR